VELSADRIERVKKHYAGDLRDGERVEDVFVVTQKAVMQTRAGAPYLKFRLADRTGHIDAIKWNASEAEIARIDDGDYALVHGAVQVYNDALQVRLDSFGRHVEEVDPSDFVPCVGRDTREMFDELKALLDEVKDPGLRRLTSVFFDDESLASRFRQAPAGAKVHHAYIGGLLEHTLNVTRLCARIAELYPRLNRDLLITGGALHDIGKIEEFTWSPIIDYSPQGNFVGHIPIGVMMVKNAADGVEGLDSLLSLHLQHLILAHHGSPEKGSAKEPMSPEAAILNHADEIDATYDQYMRAISEADAAGAKGLFTAKKHHFLGVRVFRGSIEDNGSPSAEGESDVDLLAADYDPFNAE